MLGIIFIVEFACAGLMISAIEWLQHLRGRNGPRSFEVRYLVPILAPVALVLMLSVHDAKAFPPTTTNVLIVTIGSIVCALLALWLLNEAAWHRDRARYAYQRARIRSRTRRGSRR